MTKIDTLFMTKMAEKHTLWDRTYYLYSPHKGVPVPIQGYKVIEFKAKNVSN